MLNALIRVLLEPACVACETTLERPLKGPVCPGCWLAVPRLTPPSCGRCGDALPSADDAKGPLSSSALCARCRQRPPSIEIARSAGLYDGSLREIIHAFKYGGRRMLARPLADLMRDAARPLLADADAVVPVPLHPWRAFKRGFNQADDLARELGLPVWPLLRRRRNGVPQATLPASQRPGNVRDAFALRAVTTPWNKKSRLEGRVVVLIDDVMTTGATLDACAKILLESGARSVRALTVARAVAARPAPPPPTPGPWAARRR